MSGRHGSSNPLTLAVADGCGSLLVLARSCLLVELLAAETFAAFSSVWWSLTEGKIDEGAAPSPSSKTSYFLSSVFSHFCRKNLKFSFAPFCSLTFFFIL